MDDQTVQALFRLTTEGETAVTAQQLATILTRRAIALAEPPPQTTAGQTVDLLLFSLNNEQYAVDVTSVQGIYPLNQITPVPRTPEFVIGIFSARGKLVSVVDLCRFLNLPGDLARSAESKIIIVADSATGIETGLLVDEVTDVQTIFKTVINSALTTQAGRQEQFTQGITDDHTIILNLPALLNDNQFIICEMVNG